MKTFFVIVWLIAGVDQHGNTVLVSNQFQTDPIAQTLEDCNLSLLLFEHTVQSFDTSELLFGGTFVNQWIFCEPIDEEEANARQLTNLHWGEIHDRLDLP